MSNKWNPCNQSLKVLHMQSAICACRESQLKVEYVRQT
jgi:hypothetical protein